MLRTLRESGVLGPDSVGHATPEAQVHMTLQFIGDTDTRQLDDVRESVSRACAGIGPFALAPARLVSFPLESPRVRARLVALETDRPPALMELHRRLAARFARPKRGREDVEKERLVPHLTLWRFGSGGAAPAVELRVPLPAFRVESVFLMSSLLRPEGAEHREELRVVLV